MLVDLEGYIDKGIVICPNKTQGEMIELAHLNIILPKKPPNTKIDGYKYKAEKQFWRRREMPEELGKIKGMDEWASMPIEFRRKWTPYIEEEFRRRKDGYWFYNNGEPTYITGHHYMFLQWSSIDIGYPNYLAYQRDLFIHMSACETDPRSFGQLFDKCRRSGYSYMASSAITDEGTIVKDKTIGIQSKTGSDAQEGVFMKKVLPIYRRYPFFFKPIQDGSTNPRMELAFREPSKKITKTNKTALVGEALDTIINWRSTTTNAYDSEKLHRLFMDEVFKWPSQHDINEAWRIQKTCLIQGRFIIGKAYLGSTVNPMDDGGREGKKLWENSDPLKRDANGQTASGLYRIYVSALKSLEGFFDIHGNPIIEDPEEPVMTLEGVPTEIGSRTYLTNRRNALKHDSKELNEFIRQFSFTADESFRDSVDGSLFDVGKIYDQITHNDNLYPDPVLQGNFTWKNGVRDTEVIFVPKQGGRWRISWLIPPELRNLRKERRGKLVPPNGAIGRGGVDSYDLDETVDGRGSKGACHMYNKFNMNHPSNMFVAEYISRPPKADIFYEDILMAAFYYGYPILIENNKYGIARYFERRGYLEYLMDRPEHLRSKSQARNVKTKGLPSNSVDILQTHAAAIEAYIDDHVGVNEEGEVGNMYFNRTLEDWIGFKIGSRTKFDATISSGLALLAAQDYKVEKPKAEFKEGDFFRKYDFNPHGVSHHRK